jgi:electron transfer flavoprotein beta subunit
VNNIVVCVKQVPDTYSERKLDPGDKTLDRAAADGVINELDEYAIEEALRLAEASGGTVTVLTMGPEKAIDSIRKALAMGADKAVHVVDDALHGADAVQTSAALAAALGELDADLVLLGSESTDARMSVIPAMLAERLSLPQLTYASEVAVAGSRISIRRQTEYGYEWVEATLPAVVSVVEKINEPVPIEPYRDLSRDGCRVAALWWASGRHPWLELILDGAGVVVVGLKGSVGLRWRRRGMADGRRAVGRSAWSCGWRDIGTVVAPWGDQLGCGGSAEQV